MTLTSPSFQLFMILATVAVSVATLLLWNRVRGPRPVRILSRAGLLGSSYILAAIAALVSINIAYGGLISGWSELLDNLGSTPSVGRHGRHPGRWPGPPPGQGRFPGFRHGKRLTPAVQRPTWGGWGQAGGYGLTSGT